MSLNKDSNLKVFIMRRNCENELWAIFNTKLFIIEFRVLDDYSIFIKIFISPRRMDSLCERIDLRIPTQTNHTEILKNLIPFYPKLILHLSVGSFWQSHWLHKFSCKAHSLIWLIDIVVCESSSWILYLN